MHGRYQRVLVELDVLSAVRDFVRTEAVPLEEQIDGDDAVPAEIIAACTAMGLYGFAIPQRYGGLGMSLHEEAQLAFELGWTTPALRSLFGTNNGIAGQVLLKDGTGQQPRDWLPRPASGEVTDHRAGRALVLDVAGDYDARLFRICEGTSQIQQVIIARHALGDTARG